MINRERLLAISDLKLAGKIGQMEEDKLANYVQLLNSFTESFPDHDEKIKAALEAKDNASLAKHLSAVMDILRKIYADELADDCLEHINGLCGEKHEKLESYISSFLSNLSMLSIYIQMAQLKGQADDAAAAPQEEEAARNADGVVKSILAVDDTAFFLTVLKTILQDTEYKLICVTSGNDALKFLERHNPDLLLLDIEMPGMNGYELAEKIRESGQKAPIVFLTGSAKKENVVKAVKAGAVDFIVKPINKKEVIAKIGKYII
jgi:CheY-like chemotaxis protein/HPt (histidine-containing phosphotransfer) domain-containing protein